MTKKTPKKRKAKTIGTRRTSDRVVKIAAKWMRKIQQLLRDNGEVAREWKLEVPIEELGAMAGSLVNQDEYRGRRRK